MRRDLCWGPEVIDLLLPHRPPFRLVDRIHRFEAGKSLTASKLISSNEPVFQGHFPDLALWPGVYTLEGLAQSTNLFLGLQAMVDQRDAERVRRLLTSLSARRRFKPVPGGDGDVEDLKGAGVSGFLVSADLKWRRPVFAGDVLEYEVRQPQRMLGMVQVQVEAIVGGERVADGVLTVAPRENSRG